MHHSVPYANIRFIIFSVNTLLASEQHSLSFSAMFLFLWSLEMDFRFMFNSSGRELHEGYFEQDFEVLITIWFTAVVNPFQPLLGAAGVFPGPFPFWQPFQHPFQQPPATGPAGSIPQQAGDASQQSHSGGMSGWDTLNIQRIVVLRVMEITCTAVF